MEERRGDLKQRGDQEKENNREIGEMKGRNKGKSHKNMSKNNIRESREATNKEGRKRWDLVGFQERGRWMRQRGDEKQLIFIPPIIITPKVFFIGKHTHKDKIYLKNYYLETHKPKLIT